MGASAEAPAVIKFKAVGKTPAKSGKRDSGKKKQCSSELTLTV
jgi:hypothetical protein